MFTSESAVDRFALSAIAKSQSCWIMLEIRLNTNHRRTRMANAKHKPKKRMRACRKCGMWTWTGFGWTQRECSSTCDSTCNWLDLHDIQVDKTTVLNVLHYYRKGAANKQVSKWRQECPFLHASTTEPLLIGRNAFFKPSADPTSLDILTPTHPQPNSS